MKKRLFILSVLTLFLHATSWGAYSFAVANDDGVTIYYNILGSRATVTNSGGVLFNGSYSGVVVIPETVTYNGSTYRVTSIGDRAFYGCTGLTEVTIGNRVTTIGEYAFFKCAGLTEVTIGNSVTTIGNSAFSDTRLTEVTIPNSVTTIGEGAFSGCTGLTEVTIGNSVTTIGEGAFDGCTKLTEVTIPNSVTTIGEGAFSGCTKLTEVTIPNSVTTIGERAFSGCTGLTEVTIPNSVTEMGDRAFRYCTGLTQVTIGNSVPEIGDYAFEGCTGLTEVTIGNSVTEIGVDAFYNCTGLRSIYSLNPEPPLCDTSTFVNVRKNLCTVYVPEGTKKYYELDTVWGEFYFIEEMDMTAVEDIAADGEAEVAVRYTLDGKRVSQPQRGLNIVRYQNGTVKKVLVK